MGDEPSGTSPGREPRAEQQHGSQKAEPVEREPPSPPWYRRTVTWVVGLAAAAVMAFVVAIGSGLGQQIAENLTTPEAPEEQDADTGETSEATAVPVEPLIDSYTVSIGGVVLDDPSLVEWPESDDGTELYEAAIEEAAAVPAQVQIVEVTIQNPTDAEIVVSEPVVDVVSKRPPLPGIHAAPQTGGVFQTFGYDATISRDGPTTVEPIDVGQEESIGTRFTVAPRDPVTFFLQVYVEDCDCRWQAEIPWVANGERGSTTLGGIDGQPFHLTSVEATRGLYNVYSGEYFEVADE